MLIFLDEPPLLTASSSAAGARTPNNPTHPHTNTHTQHTRASHTRNTQHNTHLHEKHVEREHRVVARPRGARHERVDARVGQRLGDEHADERLHARERRAEAEQVDERAARDALEHRLLLHARDVGAVQVLCGVFLFVCVCVCVCARAGGGGVFVRWGNARGYV